MDTCSSEVLILQAVYYSFQLVNSLGLWGRKGLEVAERDTVLFDEGFGFFYCFLQAVYQVLILHEELLRKSKYTSVCYCSGCKVELFLKEDGELANDVALVEGGHEYVFSIFILAVELYQPLDDEYN